MSTGNTTNTSEGDLSFATEKGAQLATLPQNRTLNFVPVTSAELRALSTLGILASVLYSLGTGLLFVLVDHLAFDDAIDKSSAKVIGLILLTVVLFVAAICVSVTRHRSMPPELKKLLKDG